MGAQGGRLPAAWNEMTVQQKREYLEQANNKGLAEKVLETIGSPFDSPTTKLGGFPAAWGLWSKQQQDAWLKKHDLTYAELLTQEREKGR